LQEEGISSLFGDVAQQDILDEAGIKNARLFTITFPDIRASELAIQMAKQLNPNVFCIARSRFRNYINRLYDLGADLVIYDELETGITLTRSTLEALGYPSADVLPTLQSVHDREANRLQMDLLTRQNLYGQFNLFEGLRLQWVELDKESSLIGKTLQEANLRQTFGINVLSIVDANNGECMVSPEADRPFQPGDVLVVVGTQEQMEQMQALC
jgi:CPA2 family monovalent cation:H+ antiporter-2